MRIAILGTRGIPNNYGGFEQLAQCLSLGLVQKGHEVFVYNSHNHPYKESTWQGVNIISCYDPEDKFGTFGQFIYDFNCIRDTRKRDFHAILNLGYTSSSIWIKMFPEKTLLITNMDGLEWKRTKYHKLVQIFLKRAERWAARGSDVLIADSLYIKKYLHEKYSVSPNYIAYGAELLKNAEEKSVLNFNWQPFKYNMAVARMEPENNIEMILDGVTISSSDLPFYVVGNSENKFGRYLKNKFKSDKRIVFVPPVYDQHLLNNLRYHSNIYFHGHSVGGTNPSLLEAMGCSSFVVAHNNEFNRGVLGDDAFYFNNANEVKELLVASRNDEERVISMRQNNYKKIEENYSWEKIIDEYEQLIVGSVKP